MQSPLAFGDRGPPILDPAMWTQPLNDGGHFWIAGSSSIGPIYCLAALADGPAYDPGQWAAGRVVSLSYDKAGQAFTAVELANCALRGLPQGQPGTWVARIGPSGLSVVDDSIAGIERIQRGQWQPVGAGETGAMRVQLPVTFPALGSGATWDCIVRPDLHIGIMYGRKGPRTGGDPVAQIVTSVIELAIAIVAAVTGNLACAAAEVAAIISTWYGYSQQAAQYEKAGQLWQAGITRAAGAIPGAIHGAQLRSGLARIARKPSAPPALSSHVRRQQAALVGVSGVAIGAGILASVLLS